MITAQELRKDRAEKECKPWLEWIEKGILESVEQGLTYYYFYINALSELSGAYCCDSAELADHLRSFGFDVELIEGYETARLELSW